MDESNDSRKKGVNKYDYDDDFIVGDEDDEKNWEKIKSKKNLNFRKEFQSRMAKEAEDIAKKRAVGNLKTLAQRMRGRD